MTKPNPLFPSNARKAANEKTGSDLNSDQQKDSRTAEAIKSSLTGYAKKFTGREQEFRALEAAVLNQKKENSKLLEQAVARQNELEQLRLKLEAACKERDNLREKARLADQYRQALWNQMVYSDTLTDYFLHQNRDFGKLCKSMYRDIQYILGNAQTGNDSGEIRQDLQKKLCHFFINRCREEEELMALPDESQAPPTWSPDLESNRYQDALQEIARPDRAFRLLSEKLLAVMVSGRTEGLADLLGSCGISVMFYDNAPEEARNTAFFGFYETGTELPALVGYQNDSSQPKVLARGAHVC